MLRKNNIFDCVLVSNNYLYDVSIFRNYDAPLSPYKWEVVVNFKYFNIYFDEFTLFPPKFIIRISLDYIAFLNVDGVKMGVGFYKRQIQSHVYGFYNFKDSIEGNTVDQVFTVYISPDQQIMNIVGLNTYNENALQRTIMNIKTPKIRLTNPPQFIKKRIIFQIEFANKKNIEMSFVLKSEKDLEFSENKGQNMLLLINKVILLILAVLIFIALGILLNNINNHPQEMLQNLQSGNTSRVEDIIQTPDVRSFRLKEE